MADPVRDKDQRNVANAHHAAKDLGKGWKVNPFIIVKPGETITIAEIEGPGAIQQIWMTPTGNWRFSILRMYWDDEKELPSNVRWVTSSAAHTMNMHSSPHWPFA